MPWQQSTWRPGVPFVPRDVIPGLSVLPAEDSHILHRLDANVHQEQRRLWARLTAAQPSAQHAALSQCICISNVETSISTRRRHTYRPTRSCSFPQFVTSPRLDAGMLPTHSQALAASALCPWAESCSKAQRWAEQARSSSQQQWKDIVQENKKPQGKD